MNILEKLNRHDDILLELKLNPNLTEKERMDLETEAGFIEYEVNELDSRGTAYAPYEDIL